MKINCHPERVCGVAMITADRCLPCDDYLSGSRNVFGDVLFFFLIFFGSMDFFGGFELPKNQWIGSKDHDESGNGVFFGQKNVTGFL